jgi:hypothetical protein
MCTPWQYTPIIERYCQAPPTYKQNDISGESYWVEAIDDEGMATLRSINYKCELTTSYHVKCSEFMVHYVPKPTDKFPEILEYPLKAPQHTDEWADTIWKMQTTLAIDSACAKYGDMDVVCGPNKSVFANAKFKANQCVLVPITNKIKIVSEYDESDWLFTCEGDAPVGKVLELMPMANPKNPVPAWLLSSTIEPKEANMKIVMLSVDVGSTITKGKAHVSSRKIAVPVLTNSKVLNIGTELKFHRPAKQAGIKRPYDLV